MPKRSFDEKMDYYLKKMEKLRDRYRPKRRRGSDSESYDEYEEENNYYYNIQGKNNYLIHTLPIVRILFE